MFPRGEGTGVEGGGGLLIVVSKILGAKRLSGALKKYDIHRLTAVAIPSNRFASTSRYLFFASRLRMFVQFFTSRE